MFAAEKYQTRREALIRNIPQGLILFLGNIENPINYEHNAYPFRQDSTFLYYFGIQAPKLAAILDVDQNKVTVFGDEMTIDDIVWMGRQQTLLEKCNLSGVEHLEPFEQIESHISTALRQHRTIHFLPPYQSHNKIALSTWLDCPIAALSPSVELIKAVVKQRSIKDPEEIMELEKAIDVSTQMHLLAMKMTKPGMKEYEIVSAIQQLATNNECTFAYPPIVTKHGEILHNHIHSHTLKSGDMVLNDSGVETAMGYAGDLTRTFPVDRTFTPEQRDIYQIVLQSFTDAREMLQPGVRYKDIHLKACTTLTEGLIQVGLMKGNAEDAVAQHAHTLFFQCGLGHMLGLDVHDMEDLGEQYVGYTEEFRKDTSTFGLKSLRLGKELEEGYVLTVEPGIYIIPELIDLWTADNKCADFINYDKVNAFKHFGGVRIEDNFLITPSGYRLLGSELIKTVDEIEAWRA